MYTHNLPLHFSSVLSRFCMECVPKWPPCDPTMGSGDIWLPPVKPSFLLSLTGGTKFCHIEDFGTTYGTLCRHYGTTLDTNFVHAVLK